MALVAIVVLAIAMTVFVGFERGPAPADVAVAYELAWQRRDYSTLFDLSAKELRDGMARDEFVASKRAGDAKTPARLDSEQSDRSDRITVEEVVAATDAALVVTECSGLRHRVVCERRQGRWTVVGYGLVTGSR